MTSDEPLLKDVWKDETRDAEHMDNLTPYTPRCLEAPGSEKKTLSHVNSDDFRLYLKLKHFSATYGDFNLLLSIATHMLILSSET